ncbi:MAG: ATP-dependent DNA helicase RecG, partial [Nitrospirae bacterium]|nr:ATP-dependent DNA helicase RecG [Nitrospirota bacterium]
MDSTPSDLSIQQSKGIGPHRASLLARLGISSIRDALYYLPSRYVDRSRLKPICEVRPECLETVKGRILSVSSRRTTGNASVTEVVINDGTGLLKGVWFNQPFLKKNFLSGQEIMMSGMVRMNPYFRNGLEMMSPEYESISQEGDSFIHTNRIVPVYPLTEGFGQKQFRKIMFGIVHEHIDGLEDPVPEDIVRKNKLAGLRESLLQSHFPDNGADLDSLNRGESPWQKRLIFDELFLLGLGIATVREKGRAEKGISFKCDGNLQKKLREMLPYQLTRAQERVIREIDEDMGGPFPMHRLVQGDVGSGKTIVALIAMLNAVECGYQAALMAPTEMLAEQHYMNILRTTERLGLKTLLIRGGSDNIERERAETGKADMVIGTHALIQESVRFKKLGMAVIDEQHKFGVLQRSVLGKKGANPDILVMTATPIPRSLALTLYGDLDCSVIDELPPGRKPVMTKVYAAHRKQDIYGLLRDEISRGRQAYVVYPAIEESDRSSLRSAIQGREAFCRIFPDFTIELIHGRMNTSEREDLMERFRQGLIDILVSTTVIEVGVDVPNATTMIIIHAERFGLAQLHQLRGRVGRGAEESYCLLVAYEPLGDDAKKRLEIMGRTNDGFKVAEEDLCIRGAGEFFGTRQSGMPDLRIADIVRDREVLESAGK